MNIFVSVGGTATEEQEDFVKAVEERLRSEGMVPCTVGRNTFSADAPLKAVQQLLGTCSGTVVIALERYYFETGIEKRGGPRETELSKVKLSTPWNQIEAAMSYAYDLPLMVLAEHGVKNDGLLEHGNDWYVQTISPERASLNSNEFNGVMASWKKKVNKGISDKKSSPDPSELTVGELIGGLKPTQLWSVLGALAMLLGGAFAIGKLMGGL